jgi:superfamily I DNA/RNA helicase
MAGTWWKDIDELKAEQSSLLDIHPDTNLLIKGPPGSGKTNLLLLRANQLAIGERPNLHVVVFGSLLKQFIQLGGAQYSFPPEKVVTHARLFGDILRAEGAGIDTRSMTLEAARAARAARMRELVDAGKVGVLFDALLLDEAQDYTAEEVRLFRGLTEVLVATADQRQRIYDVEDSGTVLADCIDIVHELKYHFRNGLEICRLADGLHKSTPGYVPMQQYSNYEESAYPSKVQTKPSLSLDEQAAAIAAQVADQRFAYPDDLIGVLCPTNADLDVIEAGLAAAGLAHEITRANDQDQFEPSRPIWVSTLTAAKGLEFRAVHIAGLDSLSRTGGAQKRLIFTGITRAKTALTLYWHKTIPGYLEAALLAVSPPKGPVTKKQIFGKH